MQFGIENFNDIKNIVEVVEPYRDDFYNLGYGKFSSLIFAKRYIVVDLAKKVNKKVGKKVLFLDRNNNIYTDTWENEVIVKNRIHNVYMNPLTWVDVPLEAGYSIRVEEGISSLVKKLNDMGFRTDFSCSGMRKDHIQFYTFEHPRTPMIRFKNICKEEREILMGVGRKLDLRWVDYHGEKSSLFTMKFLGTYPGGKIIMYGLIPFIHYTDDIIKKRFDEFEDEL